MRIEYFLIIGVTAGILAGIFGVGGGLIIVPALVLFAGFTQKAATGTSLVALLAPVGIGGVYAFYRSGSIGMEHIKAGLLISVGMFFGAYFGSRVGLSLSDVALKRIFCGFLVTVAVRMWISTMK